MHWQQQEDVSKVCLLGMPIDHKANKVLLHRSLDYTISAECSTLVFLHVFNGTDYLSGH